MAGDGLAAAYSRALAGENQSQITGCLCKICMAFYARRLTCYESPVIALGRSCHGTTVVLWSYQRGLP